MCVIVTVDAPAEFDPQFVKVYCQDNPHGWGFMYHQDGRVKHINAMGTPDEAAELFEKFLKAQVDFAFHCRLASKGEKNVENTHPYKIFDIDDGDPFDLYYMHNGTIQDIQVEKDMSDTYNFAKYRLRPFLEKYPDALNSDEFLGILETLIGYNKLVFLDSNNNWTTINADLGQNYDKEERIWISNKATPSRTKAYYASPMEKAWLGAMGNSVPVHRHLPAHQDKTNHARPAPGVWTFSDDGRSHFQIIQIKENDDQQWGNEPTEKLIESLNSFDGEDDYFKFVTSKPYEATDCLWTLARKNDKEFEDILKMSKTQMIILAMSDPIDFADKLVLAWMYKDGNGSA